MTSRKLSGKLQLVAETKENSDKMAATVDIGKLQETRASILDLDGKIAAARGTEAGSKKAVLERVTQENADVVNKAVSQIISNLNKTDDPVKIGIVHTLSGLFKNDEFTKVIDAFVEAEVQRVKQESGVDADSLKQLSDQRKKLLSDFDALNTVLTDMFGIDTSSVERPKASRGGGGGRPKGSTTKHTHDFYVNGNKMSDSQNSFSMVAARYTKELAKAAGSTAGKWLKEQLKANNIDRSGNWEFTLPDNTVIKAVRVDSGSEGQTTSEVPEPTNQETAA